MITMDLVWLTLLALLMPINGQQSDDGNLTSARDNETSSLYEQFHRGRCPEGFYQSGDECLYFAVDGNCFSWQQAHSICARRVKRLFQNLSESDPTNVKPAKGGRQLVLNTPHKMKILRAFLQKYKEANYSVNVLYDFNTLSRCYDGIDEDWPEYCEDNSYSNSTCFQTALNDKNNICLREIPCDDTYLRVACEFTLPGSSELTSSKFHHCIKPKVADPSTTSIPWWIWLLLVIGGILLLLFAIITIVLLILLLKSKKNSTDPVVKKDPALKPLLDSNPAAKSV
ncbi:unnamed protein product [Rotaria magnacalcarata]|uniref:C-type lectin domain-containing protein n=2 Tax=Rotaria magnacalcarata TaxID=392030 RepID=A0A816ZW91_9BILA|nr:unnamed protein product [Rotaria magnacalcarata]